MKNIITAAIAAALLSMVACNKDNAVTEVQRPGTRTITAYFENDGTKTGPGSDSRTPQWSIGDVIRILSDRNSEDITLAAENISNNRITFTLTRVHTGTLYAVYPATATGAQRSSNFSITIPDTQDGTFESANICVAKGDANDNLMFSNATAVLKFSQDAASTGVDCIEITAEETISGGFNITFGEDNKLASVTAVRPRPGSISATTTKAIKMTAKSTASDEYYVAIAPVATGNVKFAYNKSILSAHVEKQTKTLKRNTIYGLTIPTSGYDFAYVEIGGVKWGKSNLGATSIAGSYETCCGDYYQWGSTSLIYNSKTFDGTNMKWNFDWGSNDKGFHEDYLQYRDNADLPDANDVVRSTRTAGWRMPTQEDFESLRTACLSQGQTLPVAVGATPKMISSPCIYWLEENQSTFPEYTGVAGLLFCDANGNRLFIPATGYGSQPNPYSGETGPQFWELGEAAWYWTKSVSSYGYGGAAVLGCYKNQAQFVVGNEDTSDGLPIRPVYDPAD